ncbi:phosphatase PAP2 family protein [Patescibacteria group bacterium]|nr:phosphatase PAP2 family protein [Patescibacteria group bacterium]
MGNFNSKDWLKTFFSCFTVLGTPVFYIPVAFYFVQIHNSLLIKLVSIFIVVEIIGAGIKLAYYKSRPVATGHKNLYEKYLAASFPSIHSARIMAITIVVSSLYFTPLFIFISALFVLGVGYSRIYLKKHDVIDVVSGFLFGAIITVIIQAVLK